MFGKQDIMEARERLAPYIYQTPVLHLQNLDDILGCRVYIKPECMQRTNSRSEERRVGKECRL